jgi:uncharacterized membrane protein
MSDNPFQTPTVDTATLKNPVEGGPRDWDIGEVLGIGWNGFMENASVFVVGLLIPAFLMVTPITLMVFAVLSGKVQVNSVAYQGMALGASLLAMVAYPLIGSALIRPYLVVARGGTTSLADIAPDLSAYLPLLTLQLLFSGPSILVQIATMVAMSQNMVLLQALISLINIPIAIALNVAFAAGLIFAPLYCIDQHLGPVAALRASWMDTEGQRLKVFLFCFLGFVLIIMGEVVCLFPILVAAPVVYLAGVTIYTRISGRTAPAEPLPG